MKTIIVVKPETLSDTQLAELARDGITVITCSNPEFVRVIRSTEGFEGDALIDAMARAISNGDMGVKANFAVNFLNTLKEKKA